MKLLATLEIEPMGAVRMTQRSKYGELPRRYLRYKADLLWLAKLAHYELRSADRLVFKLRIPYSRRKGQNMLTEGEPHKQKPDLDNLIKGVFDALHGSDAHLFEVSSRKEWANQGAIECWGER